MLLVTTSISRLGLNPKITGRVVLWIAVFMVDVFTSQSRFAMLLNHQTPSRLPRVIPSALLGLLMVVVVLFTVISFAHGSY